ncbi:adenylate kinase [Shewanella mangrovi]|uniref:Adenylate kinase n=1 Tax=Shewanella mangrovi TaxID=1515746 RepID=A0A094LRD4_9GAMM|nr:adenylate kinase [Shewanella mangrovi]KFZ37743.1 adenylate kinase [Shewanella mangrovi]
MKKVAVFGNAGAGKSTLAKQLAEATQLPLYALDKIKYLPGGAELPHEQYLVQHAKIITQEQWIIDGFGCVTSAWQRFAAADTLIYIDLPLWLHVWWVTKRLVKGLFINPEGWPDNSPIWKSSLNSYRVLWLCHKKLTPAYRELIAKQQDKQVFHLTSKRQLHRFTLTHCR